MNLTKRQEIQLNKVFDNPKKLRKWVDDVYNDMINQCEKHTKKMINEYLDDMMSFECLINTIMINIISDFISGFFDFILCISHCNTNVN